MDIDKGEYRELMSLGNLEYVTGIEVLLGHGRPREVVSI